MVERGDKRLCGGGSSKIRQRPYLSARPGKKIFERSNETKRSSTRDVLSFFPPFSRFELTLDYCHATRHARWRGWSDRYAEGKKKKKKNVERGIACVGACVATVVWPRREKIKGREGRKIHKAGWIQANDLYGNRGNSMMV